MLKEILEFLWSILNTPAGVTACAGALLFLLNKVYDKKPGWAKFEGMLISAVKWGEKAIDDKTENAGMKRFDQALRYFIKIYTKAKGKAPSKKVLDVAKQGLAVTHDILESEGKLKKVA